MEATDLLTGSYENVRVDYFNDSYQFAEPKHYTIRTIDEFEDAKRFTANYLNYCKKGANVSDESTFWATFTTETGKELFEERVRV